MFTYVVVPVTFLLLEKLQKATVKSHYIRLSVCPFVCPRGKIWLPMDGFLQNLVTECSSKVCREASSVVSDKNNR